VNVSVNVNAETLTDEAKIAGKHGPNSISAPVTCSSLLHTHWIGLKESLAVLTRNQLFFKLALIMAASGIVFECTNDLIFNYLIVTMGFSASQNSNVLMLMGISSLLVQV
jgi:Na+/melibiose symporter-like transporter